MLRIPRIRLALSLAAVLLFAAASPVVRAQETKEAPKDRVVLNNGRVMSGYVLQENFDKVELDRDGDGKADDAVKPDEISDLTYGDAPMSFRRAQLALKLYRYEEALQEFEAAAEEKGARAFWFDQHVNYYIGECRRQLAQYDNPLLAKAREAYGAVAEKVPDGRLAPEAIKGVGVCLMQEGDYAGAERQFDRLVVRERYGPTWVMRGKLLLSKAIAHQGQNEKALSLCSEVKDAAAIAGRTDLVRDADLCSAEALVIGKQYTQAHETFVKIAKDADDRDELTKARAYNGVGDALLGADRTREALLAYLRVRVLYFKAVEELPRALFGAAKCFTALRRADEARELVSLLEKEYPRSIWTAMAKKDLGG